MAQITIYLPDHLENMARKAAKAKGKSVSKWIADEVTHSLQDTWGKDVLEAAGAVPDFPPLEEIRRGHGPDAPRESLE